MMQMSPQERKAFERHMENLMYQDSVFGAAHMEGWAEGCAEGLAVGRIEGRAEGRAEGEHEMQVEIARRMKQMNIDAEAICQVTGLTTEELTRL